MLGFQFKIEGRETDRCHTVGASTRTGDTTAEPTIVPRSTTSRMPSVASLSTLFLVTNRLRNDAIVVDIWPKVMTAGGSWWCVV